MLFKSFLVEKGNATKDLFVTNTITRVSFKNLILQTSNLRFPSYHKHASSRSPLDINTRSLTLFLLAPVDCPA
jgi:hypothetical protein